jgi:SAM-dependent methyltransferase
MKENHFDDCAADYNNILKEHVSFFDGDSDYYASYKINCLRNNIISNPGRILEYGCGIGRNLKFLKEQFPDAEISGCDLSEKSLTIAAKENPQARIFVSDGNMPDNKYNLIFISCVFHHIPSGQHIAVLKSISNLLEDNGEIFVFEHNPYNPVTVSVVRKCPIDVDAVLIKPKELKRVMEMSGLIAVKIYYTLFFPSFLKAMRPLERYMSLIPMGGQYYIQARKNFNRTDND